MKLAIRTFAVAFLFSGLVATSQIQQHSTTQINQVSVSHQAVTSLAPAPACPPDDPDGCGIGGTDPKGK